MNNTFQPTINRAARDEEVNPNSVGSTQSYESQVSKSAANETKLVPKLNLIGNTAAEWHQPMSPSSTNQFPSKEVTMDRHSN